MSDDLNGQLSSTPADDKGFEEFEIGEHRVPWFLWVFFSLIITWASISWYPFFGY
jgi:hypothetical protein